MGKLHQLLSDAGLRVADDTPATIFGRLVNLVRRVTNPESAEVAVTWTGEGIPVVTPKVSFETGDEPPVAAKGVSPDDALRLLNNVLDEAGLDVWIVLDRLDEAFQAFPTVEVPALRALFRAYLDLLEFDRIRLKLFVRKDLFRRIIEGGFVNLTHVNAKKVEIIWDDEDLFDLLGRRLSKNPAFAPSLGLDAKDHEGLFEALFAGQVDPRKRRPTTWNWILSRIRDGNHVKPPRNLIDLVSKSVSAQQRKEAREEREYRHGQAIVEGDSMKRGLAALSQERVEDTLLAEAGQHAKLIARFRDGKAEQTLQTLSQLLGVRPDEVKDRVKPLLEIGFLEEVGDTFKVPMLYRDGLDITQGKALAKGEDAGAASLPFQEE